MNILRNDEVTLIKTFENLKKIGETYEVANITDTKIVIRDKNSKLALAAVDIDNFEEYFKKDYVLNGWTDWIGITDGMNNLEAYYRTNQKRVEVKNVDGKFKGKSSCNKTDEFSLDKGIKLAMARCHKKMFAYYADEEKQKQLLIEKNLSALTEEIVAVDKFITNFGK